MNYISDSENVINGDVVVILLSVLLCGLTVLFVITSVRGGECRICLSVSVLIENLIQVLTQYARCRIYHIC